MDQRSLIKAIRNKLQTKEGVRYYGSNDFLQQATSSRVSSTEIKIIIQQTKILILEEFWSQYLSHLGSPGSAIIRYQSSDLSINLPPEAFESLSAVTNLLERYPLQYATFEPSKDSELDDVLLVANLYWLDFILDAVRRFEIQNLTSVSKGHLYEYRRIYSELQVLVYEKEERESWVDNLKQILSPMLKVYFRGIEYDFRKFTRHSLNQFIEELFKCLKHIGINSAGALNFSDDWFHWNASEAVLGLNGKPWHEVAIRPDSGLAHKNVLGCPAIFSPGTSELRYGQIFKGIYFSQMDFYARTVETYAHQRVI
jgi:hypothetical protein